MLFTLEKFLELLTKWVTLMDSSLEKSSRIRLTLLSCTVFGAWGEATADGKLYHLRALDWMPDAPVNKYPTVILYEPTEEGHPFVNIGFLGLIGSLTAMSKHGITIGEKVFWVADPS